MTEAAAKTDLASYAPSWSEYREIRGVRYHIRHWGQEGAPIIFLFHGWMDISATWQFLVDELIGQSSQDWHFVAPDWSGYGLSEPRPGGSMFIGYLADMDKLIKAYSDEQPVKIIGHSMGANLSNMYSGARPEKVSHLVNIEGLAPVPSTPNDGGIPRAVARWMEGSRGATKLYNSRAEFAQRLVHKNANLKLAQAEFLAEHFLEALPNGSFAPLADAETRQVTPIFPHVEQVEELLRNIKAQVLLCLGKKSFLVGVYKNYDAEFSARLRCFKHLERLTIQDASHNLHHEYPEIVAAKALALFARLSDLC